MRKNQNQDNRIEYKVGLDGGSVKGTPKDLEKSRSGFLKTFRCGAAIITVAALIYKIGKSLCDKWVNKSKTNDEIRKHQKETDDKIRRHKAETDDKIRFRKTQKQSNETYTSPSQFTKASEYAASQGLNVNWIDAFNINFPHEDLPPILSEIVDGSPAGFDIPMLLSASAMFGALCFSRVRAQNLEGKGDAPNLQVVIQGTSASGKSKFNTVYETLFEHLIQRDNKKLYHKKGDNIENRIIQCMGANMSKARFAQLTAFNRGVHMMMVEPEINAVNSSIRENRMDYARIRLAFNNERTTQDTMGKQIPGGSFPVFLNYVFTGVKDDVDSFILINKGEEVRGGTASRIAWCEIPKLQVGENPPTLCLPQGDWLANTQKQIDAWNKQYCIITDSDGNDHPAPVHKTDVSYVNDELRMWNKMQDMLSIHDPRTTRHDVRLRIANMAQHFAIVFHMMWGEPEEGDENRQHVINLSLYVADYLIESYMHYFDGYYKTWDGSNGNTSHNSTGNILSPSANKMTQPLSKDDKKRLVLQLWDSGIDCQAEIVRKINDKYGEGTTYPVEVGRIINENRSNK